MDRGAETVTTSATTPQSAANTVHAAPYESEAWSTRPTAR